MTHKMQDANSAKGFGQPLGIGSHPALVIVDMIQGFTSPASPLGSLMDDTVMQIRNLLDTARDNGLPIFFTTVVYHDSDFKDGGWFVKKVPALRILTPDSSWVQIDERLPYHKSEVLEKRYASAFFGTALHERLQQQGVDTLIVTGCTTSGCIRATVVDAMQYGYRPVVAEEAVADRNQAAHQQNLTDISLKYGDVVSTNWVMEHIGQM